MKLEIKSSARNTRGKQGENANMNNSQKMIDHVVNEVKESATALKRRFVRKDRPQCRNCFDAIGTAACNGCAEMEGFIGTLTKYAELYANMYREHGSGEHRTPRTVVKAVKKIKEG